VIEDDIDALKRKCWYWWAGEQVWWMGMHGKKSHGDGGCWWWVKLGNRGVTYIRWWCGTYKGLKVTMGGERRTEGGVVRGREGEVMRLGERWCRDDGGSRLVAICIQEKTLGQFNIFPARTIAFRWRAVSTLEICNYSCKELWEHTMSLYGGSQFDSEPSHLLQQVNAWPVELWAEPEHSTGSWKKKKTESCCDQRS
jgi:hypothetical protein